MLLGLVSPGRAADPSGAKSYPPQSPQALTRDMLALLADRMPVQNLQAQAFTPCVDGFAGTYPCNNVDLDAFLPLSQIGGGSASNLWGWTDSLTGKEYAILGRSTGTSFVDISDPVNPIYLGKLPTDAGSSSWREVNVDGNYAFIVCDLCGAHGMQIFDLTQLRNVPIPPVTFTDTARYLGFNTTHTITINTETHFAYANGSNTCEGGPHMIDISNPLNPAFAGCNSIDGYTHDNQCVIYQGPDAEHQGQEICFESAHRSRRSRTPRARRSGSSSTSTSGWAPHSVGRAEPREATRGTNRQADAGVIELARELNDVMDRGVHACCARRVWST